MYGRHSSSKNGKNRSREGNSLLFSIQNLHFGGAWLSAKGLVENVGTLGDVVQPLVDFLQQVPKSVAHCKHAGLWRFRFGSFNSLFCHVQNACQNNSLQFCHGVALCFDFRHHLVKTVLFVASKNSVVQSFRCAFNLFKLRFCFEGQDVWCNSLVLLLNAVVYVASNKVEGKLL